MVNLNGAEKLERRIDISAEISDYVYDYERKYTEFLRKAENIEKAPDTNSINEDSIGFIEDRMPSDTSITDAMYDEETGMAALAVEDSQTGETYIANAGTNMKADGMTDVFLVPA